MTQRHAGCLHKIILSGLELDRSLSVISHMDTTAYWLSEDGGDTGLLRSVAVIIVSEIGEFRRVLAV